MERKVIISLLIEVLLSLVIFVYLTVSTKTTGDITKSVANIENKKILVTYIYDDDTIKISNYIREYLQSDLFELNNNKLNNFHDYDTIVIIFKTIDDNFYTFLNNILDKNIILINIDNINNAVDYNNILKSSNININSFSKENIHDIIIWLKELGY